MAMRHSPGRADTDNMAARHFHTHIPAFPVPPQFRHTYPHTYPYIPHACQYVSACIDTHHTHANTSLHVSHTCVSLHMYHTVPQHITTQPHCQSMTFIHTHSIPCPHTPHPTKTSPCSHIHGFTDTVAGPDSATPVCPHLESPSVTHPHLSTLP